MMTNLLYQDTMLVYNIFPLVACTNCQCYQTCRTFVLPLNKDSRDPTNSYIV